MLKKIFIIIFLLLFLSSCGETDEISSISEGLALYQGYNFSVNIPDSWDITKNEDNIIPKPNKGNIELMASSSVIKDGIKNNLLILSDKLGSFTNSKDFSILNNVGASKDYLDYQKLDSKEITFNDDEVSMLYVFEAKYNLDTPKLKFLQTAHICNQNKVFLLTIAVSKNIKDISKYEELLSTFACKEVNSGEEIENYTDI